MIQQTIKTILLHIDSPDENRQVIINYIFEEQTINPAADKNWSFVPVNGDVNVTFETSPVAQSYAAEMENIDYVSTLDSGFTKYSINLSAKSEGTEKEKAEKPKEEDVVEEDKKDKKPKKDDLVYVVQAGDVLWKIARKHGLEWEVLAKHNKLDNPHLIYVRQKLLIPQK
jgi:2',3'-cyclic-nucleotide 2'-phosphodiesterase/3'-nucleotidase